jgi:glycolate oxidase
MEPHGTVTENIIGRLAEIVGQNNVITGEDTEAYARDEAPQATSAPPDAVVRPQTTEQVSAVVKLADEARIPVVPRGSGTGLAGGAVAFQGGIVLSLERMKRVLEVDADNFTATVEPGITLADLYEAVEERGLYYPLFPGEKSASIGGNVATNAGGMRAVKYGVTRHFVLGLEAVLPSGEIIETGGKYVKSSTAYDLTQLIIGSEGTLAVVTRITLRLSPPPGKTEILLIPFRNLRDAIRSVPDILAQGILPVGIEFMERNIIEMVERFSGKEIPLHQHEAFLMIIVEGADDDEIFRMSNRIGEICMGRDAVDVYIPGSERAKRNLIEAREKFYPAMVHFGILDIADVVVPRDMIAAFVERSSRAAEEAGISLIACGHAGDGNVHLCLMGGGTAASAEKAEALLRQIYEIGVSFGGTISGEHGLGFTKKGYLPIAADSAKMALMRRIKAAFDPNNIMNPGKLIDAWPSGTG